MPSLVCMNVAALRPPSSLRSLVSSPHRGLVEGATLVALYGVYELIRGGGNATLSAARAHTDSIVSFERHLHVFGEQSLQNAAHTVPALPSLLGAAYVLLHFVGTTTFIVWMYRRHREHFAFVRNTLIAATAIGLSIYVLYPAAPPRLSTTNGLPSSLLRTYEDHVLGKLYADWTFSRAGDALRRRGVASRPSH